MSSQPQYEFDSKQNRVIEELARAMQWIATPLQLVGFLYGLAAVLSFVHAIGHAEAAFGAVWAFLGGLFFLGLGGWTRKAAQSFQRVVTTSGTDIDNLMDALDDLRKAFSLLSVVVKIYVALILIALIAGLVGILFSAFHG